MKTNYSSIWQLEKKNDQLNISVSQTPFWSTDMGAKVPLAHVLFDTTLGQTFS